MQQLRHAVIRVAANRISKGAMPMSTASVGTLKTAGERIGPIWQRGGLLLWSLTSACSVTLLALLAGAWWQAGHAEELLTSYGSSLALAILLLMAFSALMTCVERSAAQRAGCALVLIPNEIQSHCSQCKKSGEVVTQISLHFQANNLSNNSFRLSAIRLARPLVRKRQIQQTTLSVRGPAGSAFGFEFPILPHWPTDGSASFVIDCPIGRVGKAMRVVVFIEDHAGRRYKLVFSHIKVISAP
jgi:hypothetical protein